MKVLRECLEHLAKGRFLLITNIHWNTRDFFEHQNHRQMLVKVGISQQKLAILVKPTYIKLVKPVYVGQISPAKYYIDHTVDFLSLKFGDIGVHQPAIY